MSGKIVGEILDNAPESLTTAQLLVLVAVGEDARDRDRVARFSDVASLTRRTRLAPGSIRNALSHLVAVGLLKRTTVAAHTGRHQEYRVAELYDYHRKGLS